jgi:hypothetical protein
VVETIELNSVDLRFEHTRQKDTDIERQLLSSIMERDILDPLQISVCKDARCPVLLDGFKRYRCARKLNINIIPVHCIGEDVVDGVLCLLRRESVRGLSILEQAGMIEELHKTYGLSIYTIATRLCRSPSWVSMRLGMLGELSELVRGKIMSGAFPARAYMYGIKGFTRVNKISSDRVDVFVEAVSGKGLGTRDLHVLSKAYFTGGLAMERLILEGDAHQAVKLLTTQHCTTSETTLTAVQQSFVNNLKTVAGIMRHIVVTASSMNTGSGRYMQYINTWSAAIDKNLAAFSQTIKELHDISGSTNHRTHFEQSGSQPQGNSAADTH